MKAITKTLGVLIVASAIAAAAWRLHRTAVVVAPIVRGAAVDAVYATGSVEANDRVAVKTKLPGSIVDCFVREGDVVKKGDLLARIDNPAVTFALARGKTQLGAAAKQAGARSPAVVALSQQASSIAADIAQTKTEIERSQRLSASGSVAGSDTEKLHTHLAQLQAQLAANDAQQLGTRIDLDSTEAQAEENVRALAAQVGDTEVRAPHDGVVLRRSVEPGEVVSVNQPLFEIGDVAHLQLKVAIDEADVARVSVEPPALALVTLYAFKERVFHGKVTRILPDADRASKSFTGYLVLDDAPIGLRSGMSAEVNIVVARKDDVLIAPMDAVSGGRWVWVDEGGRARRREVSLGIHDLLRAEVLGGLREGDLVVVSVVDGNATLAEGAPLSSTTSKADEPELGSHPPTSSNQ